MLGSQLQLISPLPLAPAGVTFKCVYAGVGPTTYAIDSNNYLWGVGRNNFGQLGDGSTTDRCVWVKVCCDYQYQKIATSGAHTLGIKTDGTAVAWGAGASGGLGDGTVTGKCVPVAVCCGYCYCDISAATAGGTYTSAAIKTDGTAVTWGYNAQGQLGDGTTTSRCVPVAVCCNYCYCKLETSARHTLGIKIDGTAVAWGIGTCGALGDGTTTGQCVPVAVCCDYCYSCVLAVYIAAPVSLAIKTDGTAVGWGYNSGNQLGDGTSISRCVPVAVCCNYCYCDIASKANHVTAIKTNGNAVSWGVGACGAMGDGGTTTRTQPVAVCCDYCYCGIAAGNCYSIGIKRDGTAISWGINNYSQLGDSTINNRCQPGSVCPLEVL